MFLKCNREVRLYAGKKLVKLYSITTFENNKANVQFHAICLRDSTGEYIFSQADWAALPICKESDKDI